jgi:hypothetical protein
LALNDLGEQIFERPVTLPKLNLPDIDIEAEAREAAERVAERKVIRAGLDAWQAINKAQSFQGWAAIGAALAIGRDHALRATGADAPMGRPYSWTFSAWCKRHGFGTMRPATRSWCLALHQDVAAITSWRDSLPGGRGRRRPVNPQSCVKGWQRSQAHGNGRCPQDWRREAIASWRKFVSCVAMLPPADQAAMWSMVNQTRITDVAA